MPRATMRGRMDWRGGAPAHVLATIVVGYLLVSHLLLWAFLGKLTPISGVIWLALAIGVASRSWRPGPGLDVLRVPWRVLAVCIGCATVLLALGGEGRFFYANTDWYVRNALLGDMGRSPWPYVYQADHTLWLPRAPLGMYFAPALVWPIGGERSAMMALLMQNALLVGILLALSSLLLNGRRAKAIGLAVFIAFSGLDIIGAWTMLPRPLDHIEFWMGGLQYSSTVTLLFWVPNHAIAGWIGAVFYLLWLKNIAPARLLLAACPLISIWSPLALIGLMPFVLHAGMALLLRRQLRLADIAIPALSVLIALPTLRYLGADPGGAPFSILHPPPLVVIFFQLFETLPFLVPLWMVSWARRRIDPTLIIVTAVLLALPYFRVGQSADLMARASIPALAILAYRIAVLLDEGDAALRVTLGVALLIGAVTPALEIRRALVWPAAPRVDCTLFEAWDEGPRIYHARALSKGTYLADLAKVPGMLRPSRPHIVPAYSGKACWQGYWHNPEPRWPATNTGSASPQPRPPQRRSGAGLGNSKP